MPACDTEATAAFRPLAQERAALHRPGAFPDRLDGPD